MTTGRDTTLSAIISHPVLTFCFISSRRIDSIFYHYDIIIKYYYYYYSIGSKDNVASSSKGMRFLKWFFGSTTTTGGKQGIITIFFFSYYLLLRARAATAKLYGQHDYFACVLDLFYGIGGRTGSGDKALGKLGGAEAGHG